MNRTRVLSVLLALSVSACTSMRITGNITDQQTGEPVTTGGVVSGPRTAEANFLGRYVIGVDRSWKTMQVIAPGYETKIVDFQSAPTRYPVINVQLEPKQAATRPSSARRAP